ncbi:hypothetical protein B0H14DRAFT_3491396 [Mycena olivaceomarginata]|nr:hypothetical protein B0H14DRAFT_3491396 [Mycena olivaceomarginata]
MIPIPPLGPLQLPPLLQLPPQPPPLLQPPPQPPPLLQPPPSPQPPPLLQPPPLPQPLPPLQPPLQLFGGRSYAPAHTFESEEPTTPNRRPPHPRLPGRSLSSTEVIQAPKKAPTKQDVMVLIKELYDLGTRNDIEDKYLEFRNSIDNLAKARLVKDQTLTKQNPKKLQELYTELGKSYPWFARPARPYLLERQRNQTKRTAVKKSQAAHKEAKKIFGPLTRTSSTSVHKTATPLSLRKTRSMDPLRACCGQDPLHAPGSLTCNPTRELQPDPGPATRTEAMSTSTKGLGNTFDCPIPLTLSLFLFIFLNPPRSATMVQTRQPQGIKLGRKNVERILWSRRYTSLKARRPYFHGTRTLCETPDIVSPRFPRIEDNFNDHDLQAHIHDFKIVLRHGNKETPFHVFAKRGQNIPVNLSSTAGNAGAIPFPGALPNDAAIPNGGVFKLFGDFSHEVPPKEWQAHQAELENVIAFETFETAHSVLSDNPESAGQDPPSIDPQPLTVDLVDLSKDQTRTNHVAPELRTVDLDVDQAISRPLDNMATDASGSSDYFVPGAFGYLPDATMDVEPPSGHSPPLESFAGSPNPSALSQSIHGRALPTVPDARVQQQQQWTQMQQPQQQQWTQMQQPQQQQWTQMQQPQQQQWMPTYNGQPQWMPVLQQPQNNWWPQAQAHGQYLKAQMGNHHQQAGFDSSQAWNGSALSMGGNQQFVSSGEWGPSAPQTMDNQQQPQQAAEFGSPQAWGPSALRTMDHQAGGFGSLQSPSQGPVPSLPRLDFENMSPLPAAANRRVQDNTILKEAQRTNRESGATIINLQRELEETKRAMNGLVETNNGGIQIQNVLAESHVVDLATAKADYEKSLRDEKAKHAKEMEDLRAQQAADYNKKLEREQGQNESRVAAVVARGGRPGSAQPGRSPRTALSSQYAPYSSTEAKAARDRELLQQAKRDLANDAHVLLVPREHPADPDSSKSEETLDEDEQQQAAYAWVLDKMKNEKRKKKSKSKAPPASRNKLENVRREEQERLTSSEDKLYKSMARAVFGQATGLYGAKAYKDYDPVTLDTVKLCAAGKIRPPSNKIQFYFGKDYTNCLWNRLLLARLVEKTLVLRASDQRRFGDLPDVSKDYLQALHFNVLKGAYEQWRSHQLRGDERSIDVKARVEEAEEERRLQTERNSRKGRKHLKRLRAAKKMRNIHLGKGDARTARLFENAIEVTEALGAEGMSSEEEAVRTTFTMAGQKKKRTVLVIRRQYWRATIATKYMRMIDYYSKRGKKKGNTGYDRVLIKQNSESAAPSKRVRNLYDDKWIKTQIAIDDEFEETLGIRKRMFQLVDFDFNCFSPEEDWVPGEDDGDDADVEDEDDGSDANMEDGGAAEGDADGGEAQDEDDPDGEDADMEDEDADTDV